MKFDQEIPKRNPDLIWRSLDDGVVLVSPRAGNVRVLNTAGAAIWELVDGENSVADIESCLVKQYAVSKEQAGADLHRFLTDLAERGLLTWGS